MPEKTLRLHNFLPYRLSIASNTVSDVISRAYAKLFGLSVPEWRLVAVLAETHGLTQQEIGKRTKMDKVTVSRAAIALSHRGLIVRTPNSSDGRSHRLSLSDQGAELYRRVAPHALALEARIFDTIDPDELSRFSATLEKITRTAENLAH